MGGYLQRPPSSAPPLGARPQSCCPPAAVTNHPPPHPLALAGLRWRARGAAVRKVAGWPWPRSGGGGGVEGVDRNQAFAPTRRRATAPVARPLFSFHHRGPHPPAIPSSSVPPLPASAPLISPPAPSPSRPLPRLLPHRSLLSGQRRRRHSPPFFFFFFLLSLLLLLL